MYQNAQKSKLQNYWFLQKFLFHDLLFYSVYILCLITTYVQMNHEIYNTERSLSELHQTYFILYIKQEIFTQQYIPVVA